MVPRILLLSLSIALIIKLTCLALLILKNLNPICPLVLAIPVCLQLLLTVLPKHPRLLVVSALALLAISDHSTDLASAFFKTSLFSIEASKGMVISPNFVLILKKTIVSLRALSPIHTVRFFLNHCCQRESYSCPVTTSPIR